MLSFVAAHSDNMVLDYKHHLPWEGKMPADIKRYHDLIRNKTCIMGYNTWVHGRPSVQCKKIVLVEPGTEVPEADGTIHTLDRIRLMNKPNEEIMIIGGGKVFTETVAFVDRMYLTIVHAEFKGDVFFPKYNIGDWNILERQDFTKDDENKYDYTFLTLER